MTGLWRVRGPTPDELRAHAEAHGRVWWPEGEDGAHGLWAWRHDAGAIPGIYVVRQGRRDDELLLWSEDIESDIRVSPHEGQWMPLTADGVPVAHADELERLRGLLSKLVTFEFAVAHGHARRGVWDSDNRPALRDKPCEKCHAFADAREATGQPRWVARDLDTPKPRPAGPCRPDCGCGGFGV